MSEERLIYEHPAIIHLITPKGHVSSPPLEWNGSAVEYKWDFKHETIVNGYVVTHPDGLIWYRSPAMMARISPGPFSVRVEAGDTCDDPYCQRCNP
jgi:hypothetical protein